MGTFSINMKSAQVTENTPAVSSGAGSPSATASLAGPTITGGVIAPLDDGFGLTYRDKVPLVAAATNYRLSLHMVS
jgi:hypothetical protein